jgi:hypothetical protein
MANTIQANYDLSRGIQDILPFEASSLPLKAALAPTDVPRPALLDALYAARNCQAIIGSFLGPTVRNLESLSPERYRRSLRHCRDQLKNSGDPALAALGDLLQEDCERMDLLQSFQGLLLAG